MEAAAAMDFHALSRRELQALCKRNGVRANMTNAAMADALQGLTSVDGMDEIGTTLCLPTPGRSTMKSTAVAGEEQQHGSPLPRGRRVSVMSPAAVRMDVEEGDDELKRNLVKEIVKTPGVALRCTSRRARATPAPLPTPTTLRRSQRTAARKAAAPVEVENPVEEVSTAKRSTRRASVRSKMMVDLDQEEEVAAATLMDPKALASDVECDDPAEEEVTKLLGGDNKEEEPEEGDEADSSDAANGSALLSDKSCDDLVVEKVVAVEQEATYPQEGTVEEQEPNSVQKSALLARMENSPILGVLSKAEATESVIGMAEAASVEDTEGVAEWSPVKEMVAETKDTEGVAEWSPVKQMVAETKDKVEAISEVAVKGDSFAVTDQTVHSPMETLPAATGEDETNKEDLTVEKEGTADEMQQSELTEEETSDELDEDETNEEDLTEEKEGTADEMQQSELTEEETSDELDEDEESFSDDDEASEEIESTDESEGDCTEMRTDFDNVKEELVQMMQETAIDIKASEDSEDKTSEVGSADEEASEDGSADEETSEDGSTDEETSEEDDFTSDLPPEFDNIVVPSDAETESETTSPVASATKTSVKSLDYSAISVTNKEEVSGANDVTEEAMKEVAGTVDTIVKSLDVCTIQEGTQLAEEEKLNTRVEAVRQKDYSTMSLVKLRATLKSKLAKEGMKCDEAKRLPLQEVDDNACTDC